MKEVYNDKVKITIRWPAGYVQELTNVPATHDIVKDIQTHKAFKGTYSFEVDDQFFVIKMENAQQIQIEPQKESDIVQK